MSAEYRVECADAADLLATLEDNSVDLIVTDPPYFRVVDEPWDRAWDDADAFLSWLGGLAEGWQRVLRPNGSLYVFASPQMAARVELALEGAGFVVLSRPVWTKTTRSSAVIYRANRDSLTVYHSGDNERIIFAQPLKEHRGAKDAKNAHANALHALRAQVFAPLREYLAGERDRSGWSNKEIDAALGCTGMARHWFDASQWSLPSRDRYHALQELLNTGPPGDVLRRDYDDLRRDYDDLRMRPDHYDLRRDNDHLLRDYYDLRRTFDLGPESAARPRGEVWQFAPVKGDHPCEKPQPLLRHMILTSSRPGDLVLDTFAGSGSTGVAAVTADRRFVGCDASPHWAEVATRNVVNAANHRQGDLFEGATA